MNIFIGGLSYQLTDDELKTAFEPHGEVDSARIIMDRESGRSKGFGFVEMPDREQALAAINAINGTEIGSRTVTVNEARPKPQRDSHRGGGYGGGRGDGFGGGRNRY